MPGKDIPKRLSLSEHHHWGIPMDPVRKLNARKKGGEEWKKSILICGL
jgi:hypothetical protein